MADDAFLLDRLRNLMREKNVAYVEKKMFGGHCFMVDDKMCFGTYQGGLMARVDPDDMEGLEQRTGAQQIVHGGRPMKGYLNIAPDGYDSENDLSYWINKCLEFNPKAKSSKKK